ncbi:MAG TPA: hydantoinase/oxoprolinase family protein [Solirubrobacter sp.]|nr:hydantoinase/oxoprolinase family protein [Solirubrobacter sp.]
MSGQLAIDIGGTFTDVVYQDREGRARALKVSTTPENITNGIIEGANRADVELSGLESFVHGTTIALNALLEGKNAPLALITTSGFRDVLEIMRTARPNMYDLQQVKPVPLVPRRNRYEISARMAYDGGEIRPVVADEVREIARTLKATGMASVAVCLLHAYADDTHEQQVRAILAEQMPEAFVSLSSELSRVWREFERTSTAVANAAAKPLVARYMEDLERRLGDGGFAGQVLIMQSNGGVMSGADARQRPVATLMSGPIGGVTGALSIARQLDPDSNIVTLDIGGTSADVAIIDRGEAVARAVGQIGGWPIMVPMIDIESIGAGGGSIARVDEFGGLSVGPQSAGASPGPACYGRGGDFATVTDANVVLGRIDPAYFLGGQLTLDTEAAERVVRQNVAEPLGMDLEQAAEGVITVINSNMRRLLWEVMIGRGYDPREFKLLAFGGAGPLHACQLAQSLGIAEVIVPVEPGTFSAMGILGADVRHDLDRMVVAIPDLDDAAVEEAYRELEASGRERLEAEDVNYARIDVIRAAELRYFGQDHLLAVELQGDASTPLAEATQLFHDKHERLYGFRRDDVPVELVRLQLAVVGRRSEVEAAAPASRNGNASGTSARRLFAGGAWRDAKSYDRGSLSAGTTVDGPCIIEEPGCTTYVPAGFSAKVDELGLLRIAVPPMPSVNSDEEII